MLNRITLSGLAALAKQELVMEPICTYQAEKGLLSAGSRVKVH